MIRLQLGSRILALAVHNRRKRVTIKETLLCINYTCEGDAAQGMVRHTFFVVHIGRRRESVQARPGQFPLRKGDRIYRYAWPQSVEGTVGLGWRGADLTGKRLTTTGITLL